MDAVTTAARAATSADDALVRRARTGDAAAFEMLVDTRIDRCYRLAWSILSNDADAADATQDALVFDVCAGPRRAARHHRVHPDQFPPLTPSIGRRATRRRLELKRLT